MELGAIHQRKAGKGKEQAVGKKDTSDKLEEEKGGGGVGVGGVLKWCCHRDESFQTSSQNGVES